MRKKAASAATSTPKSTPTPGSARTVTFPERPIFLLNESVYDDVKEKAARWHELGREIEARTLEEQRKAEDLKKLGEREAQERISLESEMDTLQDEIEKVRRARERAQVRLEPALRAAWRAALEAKERVWKQTREYDVKLAAYRLALNAVFLALQRASADWVTGSDLRAGAYDRHHVTERFSLPEVSSEFERGLPERAPYAPPTGKEVWGPEQVVVYVEAEPRRPVKPVTHEDVEFLVRAAEAESQGHEPATSDASEPGAGAVS